MKVHQVQAGATPAQSRLTLTAYKVSDGPFSIVPAFTPRAWMDATPDRFAYRCLPMVIANQAGWFITIDVEVRATWNGGVSQSDLEVDIDADETCLVADSHFGSGVLTWHVPYLFRTPVGYNLLVRGPSNMPLDGACALEGIVETDWAIATFTMNWKLTRHGSQVVFPRGYPIAMIVPQRRYELERFDPVRRSLGSDPALLQSYMSWREERAQFNNDLQDLQPEAVQKEWQRHYFQGNAPSGVTAPEHQVKLSLRPFEEAGE